MRNLRSYIQSWWYRDLGEDIMDDDAYDRFMDWMSDPTVINKAEKLAEVFQE